MKASQLIIRLAQKIEDNGDFDVGILQAGRGKVSKVWGIEDFRPENFFLITVDFPQEIVEWKEAKEIIK